jgi:hypothetical protein
MSVSYLAELSDQLRASVSTFRLPEKAGELSEVYPGGMPQLSSPESNGQFDMGMNGDWNQNFSNQNQNFSNQNQNFSNDYLSSQPLETGNTGAYQFGSNGQQDFAASAGFPSLPQLPPGQPNFGNQPNYGGQPAAGFGGPNNFGSGQLANQGYPQNFGSPFAAQGNFGSQSQGNPNPSGNLANQGFNNPSGNLANQGFGALPNSGPNSFDNPNFGNFNTGFPSQAGFNDFASFPDQTSVFENQPFGNLPESGYGNQIQPLFPRSGQQLPSVPPTPAGQQGQGNQAPGRPRWQNQPAGQPPYPGNGHQG